MAERVGRISMLDPIFRCWDGRRNRQMVMGSINGFYERWLNSPLRHYSAEQLFYYFSCQDLSLTEKTVFENPEVAKYVLQRFLNINDQMDESILTVEKDTSVEEYKAFKRGVGYVMYEIFEKIIEPICKRHPSLKPPEMES
jgi:hypothetical protein